MSYRKALATSRKVFGEEHPQTATGCRILYELLCGELSFRGSKLMILAQVVNDDPKAPRRLNDRIARNLEVTARSASSDANMARTPSRGVRAAPGVRIG
jgi:hypothetical protein